ncbi:hypothetical protein [Lysobacter gummosus]|uniref:hypothetical protein n=1 Tax=Lysobacter gummosus TaxID=262324 RepID=UPI00362C4C96
MRRVAAQSRCGRLGGFCGRRLQPRCLSVRFAAPERKASGLPAKAMPLSSGGMMAA